jgi:hypothetical protein
LASALLPASPCAHPGLSTMDTRQPPPPFQRPPDRPVLHKAAYPSSTAQPYAAYLPTTSQPQQPLHVPFVADPYAASRRDPFFPAAAQHARPNSQGILGGDSAPQAQAEQQGNWAQSGTGYTHNHVSGTRRVRHRAAMRVLEAQVESQKTAWAVVLLLHAGSGQAAPRLRPEAQEPLTPTKLH